MKKKSKAAKKKKKVVQKAKKRPAAKKKIVKKTAKKKSVKTTKTKAAAPVISPSHIPAANETVLGEVEDFFGHIGVIALTLKAPLALGDTIHVRGHTTDLTGKIQSMQIDRKPIQQAKKGDSVGIKVDDKCRKGDAVFRVNE